MIFNPGSDESESPVTLTGRVVVDNQVAKVGKVTDVVIDEQAEQRWVVVKTGVLSGEHFVPLNDTYVDASGRLVVPLDRAAIKRAPRTRSDHILTVQRRHELRDYYGIAA
jgi:hypothetical protein